MNEVPAIWKEPRVVESHDADALGALRPQSLLAILLNAAWNHSRPTEYGYEPLLARDLMWVLVKMQMVIHRVPRWGERIAIETWGKRTVKLYALRDYVVLSDAREKLVSATSSWLIINRSTGRPWRYDRDADHFPWRPGEDVLETRLEKVPELPAGRELARFRAVFSDLDVNGHVNSARYLQWMIDSHSDEQLRAREPASIELSYLAEALAKDEVAVFAEDAGAAELCAVRRAADGKDVCRARIEWRERR